MRILVNGEARSFSGESLSDLLATLSLAPGRLACEVNGAVIRRADYAATRLRDNDKIEIVQMIGGG